MAVMLISEVGASDAAAGFHGKPVNMVPRSHSVIAHAPPSVSTSATRLSRPKRQARPAAIAG